MPWVDSMKKIRRKTGGGNGRFAIFSTKSHIRRFLRHGEANSGYLLVSAVLFCLPLCRMFEPPCDSIIRKGGKQKEAINGTISAMTGISVMVEIVLW
jgi:hypothetical protein